MNQHQSNPLTMASDNGLIGLEIDIYVQHVLRPALISAIDHAINVGQGRIQVNIEPIGGYKTVYI